MPRYCNNCSHSVTLEVHHAIESANDVLKVNCFRVVVNVGESMSMDNDCFAS